MLIDQFSNDLFDSVLVGLAADAAGLGGQDVHTGLSENFVILIDRCLSDLKGFGNHDATPYGRGEFIGIRIPEAPDNLDDRGGITINEA